jgi:hypothetical protein
VFDSAQLEEAVLSDEHKAFSLRLDNDRTVDRGTMMRRQVLGLHARVRCNVQFAAMSSMETPCSTKSSRILESGRASISFFMTVPPFCIRNG